MMSNRVVSNDGLKMLAKGCSVAIRVPWYRSLPVSVVEVVEIEVNGVVVPLDDVQFCIEGEMIPLNELETHTEEVWYVLDDAYLIAPSITVSRGVEYQIAVTLAIYPPYIEDYKRITRTEKRLTAR